MKIKDFEIKNYGTPYVIAEIGGNHNGDLELAKKLIQAAKDAGCHSAKFQSWSAESLFSKKVYEENYFLADDYRDREDYNLKEIVEEYAFGLEEMIACKEECDRVGIDFGTSIFSPEELDQAVDILNVPYLKVASMDIPNTDFLEKIALKKLPTILSTGLSSISEITRAVDVFERVGNTELMILHCVSQYPPEDTAVNLNNIKMLQDIYPNYPVGFSDHTIGTTIPLASVALGACIIEKHFTLDKEMFGWDHHCSSTPDEMKEIVEGSLRVRDSLGQYHRSVTDTDKHIAASYRRSIVSSRDIKAGEVIRREDIDFKRPGTGISPHLWDTVVGCTAQVDIEADVVLEEQHYKAGGQSAQKAKAA